MALAAGQEWVFLRAALVVVAVVAVVDVAVWKVRDLTVDKPSRLELTVRCLRDEKGVTPVVPAADPLATSAGDGSLQVTIEGNGVTVALASSVEQAMKIVRDYRALASGLEGRLERRDRAVYLWLNVSSPTQRQVMYDCQY
jgi:uncharacterized membrane-anchored protein